MQQGHKQYNSVLYCKSDAQNLSINETHNPYSMSVECMFSIAPAEEQEEIHRRWSACSQQTPCHVSSAT